MSDTFQKTKGIIRPGWVSPASVVYQISPLPFMPPVEWPFMVMLVPVRMNAALWFWKGIG